VQSEARRLQRNGHEGIRMMASSDRDVRSCKHTHLAVLGPFILAADLVLFLRCEVVLDVEGLADFLGRLALDHVGDGLATDVKESLDVEVVGSQDDLEEHLLVHLHVLLVPLLNVGRLLARVGIVIGGRHGVVLVMLAPFHNLLEDSLVDVRDWDRFGGGLGGKVIEQVLDEDGALGDLALNSHIDAIGGRKLDHGHWGGRSTS